VPGPLPSDAYETSMSTANQFGQTTTKPEPCESYEFGPFVLDTVRHALLKQGAQVDITPKTYDTLLVLLQNNPRMLSKEELMQTLWPNSFVEESNLTQQISMIRKALGESAGDRRYIVTVPGRGYRFTGDVKAVEGHRERTGSDVVSQVTGSTGVRIAGQQPLEYADLSASKISRGVPRPFSTARATNKRNTLFFIAGFALLAVAVVAITKFVYLARVNPPQPVTPRSLAILPLQNLKEDADSEFLGYSLADAVITKLDYISSLTVRPSSAVQKYRNKVIDIASVGGDLKVDTLLTGSFIRDGDNLRITYQLIDVKTENILGRGTIDLKYDNLLRVQDNVANEIVHKLELNLSRSEAERIKPETPVKPLAYEYYLRGVDLHGRHEFPLAIKMLERSTEIDPNYALAWAYLGASYTSDAAFELGGREQYDRAENAYERALAIQPHQMDAQMFLANLFVDTGKVEKAVPLLRDALKANDNYAPVHWELGYAYRFAGMLNESVEECERARQLDPSVKSNGSVLNTYLYLGEYDKFLASLPEVNDSSFILFYRGFGEFYEKDFRRATEDFDRANELDSTLYTQIGKALSDSIAQRQTDGLQIARVLERKIADRGVGDPEALYKIAEAYAVLGDRISALRTLRDSVDSGFFSYPYIAKDPLLNGIRGEAQFQQILQTARQHHEAFKRTFF
jgi:DNA-binding winged helix-turn-helix (wHTH) protein/TolB-like protein/Tfp pilus assembly protein PilF